VGNEVNNIGALVNSGTVGIAGTLNLTGGGPGITDVVAGSTLFQSGTLNVINDGVATNGLANLQSVAGFLALRNSQTTSVTPGTGTLVNSGTLLVTCASTLSVNGNADNTGIFETSVGLDLTGFVNVSGTFVNASGAVLNVQGGVGALVPDRVTAGRLTNAGAVTLGLGLETVGGLLQVGSGTPNLTRGYDQLANGQLDELLGGPSSFGTINVTTGAVSLNGVLDNVLEDGFTPAVGQSFQFLSFTSGQLSGTFASIQGDVFNNGLEKFVVNYDNADGRVLLTVEGNAATAPEPAKLLLAGIGLVVLGTWRRRSGEKQAI
jgi:hypothetical protein